MNRYTKVRELVKDPSLTIKDIAQQTGYDKGHVSRLRKASQQFECPRCGHCCKSDLARVGEIGVWLTPEEMERFAALVAKHEREACAKVWSERCEEHPDHQERIISERMIQARMQEEIDDLRQALETKHEWVGLTDDAVFELADTNLYDGGKNYGVLAFAKAIEQALKEKNHG